MNDENNKLVQLYEAEEKGRHLYKTNENYRTLANIMEHPEFRKFYDTHMNDPLSLQTVLMFLKVYESIEKKSKISITPYQKLAILHEIFICPELRQQVVTGITSWGDGHFLSNSKSHKNIEPNTDPKYLLEQ